jgi:hypothetical protein
MSEYGEPDASEKRVRFGCGFVFGGIIGFFFALREIAAFTGTFWAFVAGIAVLFGFLAMRYGDEFWHSLPDWLRWW